MISDDNIIHIGTGLSYIWIREAPLALMLYADDGEVLCTSKIWSEVSGYAVENLSTTAEYAKRTLKGREKDADAFIRSAFDTSGIQHEQNFPVILKDGRERICDFYSCCIGQLPDGRRIAMSAAIDVTDRSRLHSYILQKKVFFETTLASVADGVISTDKAGKIKFMNTSAEILTGWTLADAENVPLIDIFQVLNPFSKENTAEMVEAALRGERRTEQRNRGLMTSRDGIERPVEISISPILYKEGDPGGAVIVFRDYSDQERKEREIEYLSYHDQLTGLYNRRFYEEELRRLDTRRNYPIALVMADVNGLKLTNDAFGHMEGDILLKRIACILSRECRSDDIIARVGGDEFVLLLPKTDENQAGMMIARILDMVAEERPDRVIMSISIGLAVKKDAADSMHEVFKRAEDAMYRDKLTESTKVKRKTVDLILHSLYEKNKKEISHSQRVSALCEALAGRLQMDRDDIKDLRTAGLLHDIGNIGIDSAIMEKPSSLDASDWHEIMKHPEIGYRILSSVDEYAKIAVYVLQHQEKWDGTGYPRALKGEEISIPARIIGIADAYDAMTTAKPYREALDNDQAAAEIAEFSGTQFDPAIARIFVEQVLGKAWQQPERKSADLLQA